MHEGAQAAQEPSRCATCTAVLAGPFCSACGEERLDPHSLTLRHFFAHNLLHEFTHVDGKIFRTFRYLLFRPGLLSAEYFAGRRGPYVNPIRVLITAVILFALFVPASGTMSMSIGKARLSLLPPGPPQDKNIGETIKKLDVFGLLSSEFAAMRAKKDLESEKAVEKFNHELETYGEALSLFNVILLAVVLFVMFRGLRPYFVEHFVFSLHLAAFLLLFSLAPWAVFRPLLLLDTRSVPFRVLASVAIFAILVIQVWYLHSAIGRFYYAGARRPWRTAAAVFVIFLMNAVFLTIVYGAGAAIALLRV